MIRRRTDAERAAARLRRLNDPQTRSKKRNRRLPFPEPGAIQQLFQEARRIGR